MEVTLRVMERALFFLRSPLPRLINFVIIIERLAGIREVREGWGVSVSKINDCID